MRDVKWFWLGVPAILWAGVAGAREPEPQEQEVDANVDIGVANEYDGSTFDVQYLYTPEGLNRVDEVHPVLRRFVHHPSALFADVNRFADSNALSTSSAQVGGIGYLFDGLLYGTAQGGFEIDRVNNANEDGYWTLPYRAEVGVRPLPLLQIGAYWDAPPVIHATTDDTIVVGQAQRSGNEEHAGGIVSWATGDDRLFLSASAAYHEADWTFIIFHPGKTSIRGATAHLTIAIQPTPTTSIQLRFDGSRDHWVDVRANDSQVDWIGLDTDRIVYNAGGSIDLYYWYKGRLGFRGSFGGGYMGAPPIFESVQRGYAQIGFGIITRF